MQADPLQTALTRDAEAIGQALKLRFFPLVVERGEGAHLIDVSGRAYLDFSSGWSVAATGYDHSLVRQRIAEQFGKVSFSGLISSINLPALELAERLIALTPGGFAKKVWFGFCGSDANETVGRLLPRATGRPKLLTFEGSYHGFTAASMAMSGHVAFEAYSQPGGDVIKLPYPDPYRPPFGASPEQAGQAVLEYIEQVVFKDMCRGEEVGGVIIEAFQSDGGDIRPPDDFLPGLEALCRRHGIWLILDEVKIGMGRTGRLFGFEHYGITPDVVVLGKSLGGGLPLSAVVARAELLDVAPAAALFTGVGNATCCAAGLAVLDALEQDKLAQNAHQVGAHLLGKLRQMQARQPLIGDVRGQGLILGVELVRDQASRGPASREAAKVVYRAFELGLVLFYVGTHANVLEITPPLVLNQAEADEGAAILEQALADVAAGRVSDEAVAQYAGWA